MIHRFGDYQLDAARFELSRDARPLAVEPQVLDLLITLIEHRDRVVSRDELFETVWKGRAVSDAALSSRIKTARQAIGDDGGRQAYIRTIHGRGFRFVGRVDAHDAQAPAAGRPRAVPTRTARSRATRGAATCTSPTSCSATGPST